MAKGHRREVPHVHGVGGRAQGSGQGSGGAEDGHGQEGSEGTNQGWHYMSDDANSTCHFM